MTTYHVKLPGYSQLHFENVLKGNWFIPIYLHSNAYLAVIQKLLNRLGKGLDLLLVVTAEDPPKAALHDGLEELQGVKNGEDFLWHYFAKLAKLLEEPDKQLGAKNTKETPKAPVDIGAIQSSSKPAVYRPLAPPPQCQWRPHLLQELV